MKQAIVKMRLVGEDGNAFAILGRFARAARTAGWSKAEIDKVLTDARGGDYYNLLSVIMDNVEEPDDVCDNCEERGSDCECDEDE
jgi:hypothetical protein